MQEPCHKLAWTLDACYRDHVLDERRLKELSSIIQGLQSTKGKAKSSKRGRDWESHAEPSALKSDQPLRVLAEAGMIIRDPSVFHLIIHQACTSKSAVPPKLICSGKILGLNCSPRGCLMSRVCAYQ